MFFYLFAQNPKPQWFSAAVLLEACFVFSCFFWTCPSSCLWNASKLPTDRHMNARFQLSIKQPCRSSLSVPARRPEVSGRGWFQKVWSDVAWQCPQGFSAVVHARSGLLSPACVAAFVLPVSQTRNWHSVPADFLLTWRDGQWGWEWLWVTFLSSRRDMVNCRNDKGHPWPSCRVKLMRGIFNKEGMRSGIVLPVIMTTLHIARNYLLGKFMWR